MKIRPGTLAAAFALFIGAFAVTRVLRSTRSQHAASEAQASSEGGEVPVLQPPSTAGERLPGAVSDEATAARSLQGTELSISVYARHGPLEGALVRVEGSLAEGPAVTSREGKASVRVGVVTGSQYRHVRTSAEGFFPSEIWILARSARADVLLEEPAKLRGTVLDSAGNPPPAEMTVLGWPVKMYKDLPAEEVFASLRDGAPSKPGDRIRATRAESDGSFLLEGLEPGVRTFVAAGGPGWATLVAAVSLPTDEPVRLEARRVFGASIRILDETGEPALLSKTLQLSCNKAWGTETAEAAVCDTAELAAALAGLDPIEITNSPTRITCMYLSDSLADRIGPCAFRYSITGYRPIDLTFDPTRVDLGLLPVEAVLESLFEENGSIRLQPTGVSDSVRVSYADAVRLSDVTDNYVLELRSSEEANSRTLSFGVELALDGSSHASDIPAGEYEYRLRSLHQLCTIPPDDLPPGRVRVLDRQTTNVTLDLSSCATVTLEFTAVDGSLYNGAMQFSIAPGRPTPEGKLKRVRRMTLDAGPYVVGLVAAGTHTIRGWGPNLGPPADGNGYFSFDVPPGTAHVLALSVLP